MPVTPLGGEQLDRSMLESARRCRRRAAAAPAPAPAPADLTFALAPSSRQASQAE
jgi:hypothetical protein